MEAGKKRLAGDIVRQASTSEVTELRREARDLKEVAAADLAERKMTDAVNKFIADDIAASEARQKARQQQRIDGRIQELLRVSGSKYGYNPEKAREQAKREIMGPPAYEDDINVEPEKPNRQAILKGSRAIP